MTGHAELVFTLGQQRAEEVLGAIGQAGARIEHPGARWLPTHETSFALVLPNCTKHRAVEIGDELIAVLRAIISRVGGDAGVTVSLSAGAASISLPP
jgi:hypothetical protein